MVAAHLTQPVDCSIAVAPCGLPAYTECILREGCRIRLEPRTASMTYQIRNRDTVCTSVSTWASVACQCCHQTLVRRHCEGSNSAQETEECTRPYLPQHQGEGSTGLHVQDRISQHGDHQAAHAHSPAHAYLSACTSLRALACLPECMHLLNQLCILGPLHFTVQGHLVKPWAVRSGTRAVRSRTRGGMQQDKGSTQRDKDSQ
jgi:hypothetical protein